MDIIISKSQVPAATRNGRVYPEGSIIYVTNTNLPIGSTGGGNGVIGENGADGASGYSGYSGYSGLNGEAAAQGLSGYSGYSGINGIDGISGYSGATGERGISGYSGAQGLTGLSGYSGISPTGGTDVDFSYDEVGNILYVKNLELGSGYLRYLDGNQANGKVLTTNASGYATWETPTGGTGTQGISGYSGYSGFNGEDGKDGADGIQGISGYSGMTGQNGIGTQGISGYSGYSGTNGEDGKDGADGISGYSGYSGIDGTVADGYDYFLTSVGETVGAKITGKNASTMNGYKGLEFVGASGIEVAATGFNGGYQKITITGSGGGSGTGLTSVGLTMPSIMTVANSPLDENGTLAVTLNTQQPNLVFASPSGGSVPKVPTFRELTVNDLPTLPYDFYGAFKAGKTGALANIVGINSLLGLQGISFIEGSNVTITTAPQVDNTLGIIFNSTGGGTGTGTTGDWSFDGNTIGSKKTIGSLDNYGIGLITNGVERLTVGDGEGFVGIGRYPSYRLDVEGSIGIKGLRTVYVPNQTANTGSLIYGTGGGFLEGTVYKHNTHIGIGAGYYLATGARNTMVGSQAAYTSTNGRDNTSIGYRAGFAGTTGVSRTAVGTNAGASNTTGSSWTAVGENAGTSITTGGSWTAVGQGAALSITTGRSFTAIGNLAAGGITEGYGFIAIGNDAAKMMNNGSIAEKIRDGIYIGNSSTVSEINAINEIVIGNNAEGGGNHSVNLGNAQTVKTMLHGQVGIGMYSPTADIDIEGTTIRLRNNRTITSSTATGWKGEICWDNNYVYVCVADNTWKRTALQNW